MISVKVEWVPVKAAEERLRRVFDLLLREAEREIQPRPTVRELLLKGILVSDKATPSDTLG